MSRHTSWRVGGNADVYLVPADREDLLAALSVLEKEAIPWMVLGGGSNLLVRDGGIRGAVIDTAALNRLEFLSGGEVRAEAGVVLGQLIEEAARRGLAGLELLYGIPGTVGGALAMNAGVPGREFGERVESALIVEGGTMSRWDRQRLRFGYRRSALTSGMIAVEARLLFSPGESEALQTVLRERLAYRRRTQKVEGANAGSVFRNPPGAKAWELIEEAGLKGASVGGAQVSRFHANFIVNQGKAQAEDILALIQRIQKEVESSSGIRLEPEVKIVGENTALNG
ncbi:MAG: UDP-N-acetylmuramate dehydrogenase [Desulfuromonadaceae bacterium]|nr:UDP-N-acetylmuramate dehydrogenase [Desulfuromonadaceae bacterium]